MAVTCGPLCHAAISVERRIAARVTSGELRQSDLVMYKRLTERWWQHCEGRAILGDAAGAEGTRAPRQPSAPPSRSSAATFASPLTSRA